MGIKVVREGHENVRFARQVPLSGKRMHSDAIGLQHAPDFLQVLVRISCVLQHASAQHDIEEIVLEREPIWSSADLPTPLPCGTIEVRIASVGVVSAA